MNTASLANLTRGGPKAGSKNRHTVEIRAMIEAALDKAGGVDYLVDQAHENPAAFLTLLGKILPRNIDASIHGPDGAPAVTVIRRIIVDPKGIERA